MSGVIEFLEGAGKNTALAPIDYDAAVAALDVDDAQREALAARDSALLGELLQGRTKMFCLINAPEEDEPGFEDAPDDADDLGLPESEESDPPQR